MTSGLGAQAGLVTAVIAGAVAAVFGGSNLQVSGPTGAMTVVLVPVVHQFGVNGVLMAGLIAGVALIAMAAAKVGRYVRYLPLPVIEGFTAGIAVVIALQQVPTALGIESAEGDHVWQVAADAAWQFALHPAPAPALMTVAVASLMLLGTRWRPGIPFSLVAIVAATLAAAVAPIDVALLGPLPTGLPAPSLAFIDVGAIMTLLPSALAVAALAALESLLSATVADGMTVNERHDPDRELFGQGLANVAAPLFGGIPATAAIARTAVNVRAGASSKLAALVHALVLAVIVYTAGPLVSQIPLAALAGVLLATTARMVDPASLRALLSTTRADAAVLLLTFTLTVAVDLVTAVAVGVGVAIVLALRAIAQTASFPQVPIDRVNHSEEEHALLSQRIVAYRPEGPLFFGAANRFLMELTDIADVEVLILRMSAITTMDATGAHIIGDTIEHLQRRGVTVLLSGIADDHHQLLRTVGIARQLHDEGRIFADTPSAIAFARTLTAGA